RECFSQQNISLCSGRQENPTKLSCLTRRPGCSPSVIGGVARVEFPAFRAEDTKMRQPRFLQGKLQRRREHPEAVGHAAAEVDGGCFFEILGRARYLANAETKVHTLCQHLIVEDEIIGVLE